MGAPLLKDFILPTVKEEAGQVLKDIMSGVEVKNALKRGAKRAGKTILKRGIQCIMQGKGCPHKRKCEASTALSMLLKGINNPKWR